MKSELLHIGAASALFLVLTLLFTAPLVMNLTTHIPGYSGDINQYYWCHWWFGEAMARGMNPWWTDMLWSPNGTSLVFSTNRFVSSFFGWLITPLTGQIAAYNIIILLSFVASALGVYLFVRELTGNNAAAFAAAFIFTFNPWKFHKLQCHHFLMSTWFFGFALWMLVRVLQRKEKPIKHGILLGIFGGVMIYESLFLFDFLLLALATVTLLLALFDRINFWHVSRLKGLLAAGLTFIILATPMFIMIAGALPDYGSLPYAAGAEQFSNDLLNLFWPSPLPWSGFGERTSQLFTPDTQVYRSGDENFGPLGWVVLPLAIAGWWLGRRKYRAIADASLFCMLFFSALSLGPALHIGSANTSVPMPYAFLSWLPPFGLVRAPSRFIIIAFLFAGILAALAIAHIARIKQLKSARLLLSGLIILLLLDYMPHGSAMQDQRDYPNTVDTLAAVEGDFAAMPFGYFYIDTMRFAPIHGKPVTAGYVSRNTLFGRPVQESLVHLLSALLSANDKAPGTERVNAMADSTKTFLRAANVGAILYLGDENRLIATTKLLNGEILEHEGDHALILLPREIPTAKSLTIDADTWPPMPSANLGGSIHAEQLWTGFKGFRLTIPADLMPEEKITFTVSSAVRDSQGRKHYLLVTVNGISVARIELSEISATYSVQMPKNIRRLPMNIIEFTQEFGLDMQSSKLPFKINALSGNLHAGNYSALSVEGKELLPYEHRVASFNLATVDTDGSAALVGEYPIHEDDFADRFKPAFLDALQKPWTILIACGEISPAAAELSATIVAEAGLEIDRRDIRGRSVVAIFNTRGREAMLHSAREGYIHLISGPVQNPATPTLNIDEIRFH